MSTTLPTKRGSFNKHPDFNKKILVVDDEAAILQTLRYNLERSGHEVVTASDGRSAITMAQNEEPDLIVLTGDYVATSRDSVTPFMQAINGLQARHGVYGVLGNHDLFTGSVPLLLDQFARRNFKLMINEQEWLEQNGAKLNLLGVTYLSQNSINLAESLAGLTTSGPSILLSHQPNVLPEAAGLNIDLVLSGHLHGGQVKVELLGADIAPSKIISPYVSGVYRHRTAQMYLSRGLGTTAAPVRINSRPEITEITLVRDLGS